MKKLIIFLLVIFSLATKADSPKVSFIQLISETFSNEHPLGQDTKDLIDDNRKSNSDLGIIPVRNALFLEAFERIVYNLPQSQRVLNDSAAIDVRLVCLIHKGSKIDTLVFGRGGSWDEKRVMQFNEHYYYQNDILLKTIATFLPEDHKIAIYEDIIIQEMRPLFKDLEKDK